MPDDDDKTSSDLYKAVHRIAGEEVESDFALSPCRMGMISGNDPY